MRHNFICSVTLINRWLENLHSLPCDPGTPQAPDQLFAFSGEHGSYHYFDPTHISFDDIHTGSLPFILSAGRSFPIHRLIEKWRERRNQRHTERFLPSNLVRAQHAPCASRVANSNFTGKMIDRNG